MSNEFIVLSRQNATASNNTPYATLKAATKEDNEIVNYSIRIFDLTPEEGPKYGQLVSFRALSDYQGSKNAKKMDMFGIADPQPSHPLYNLIPRPIAKELWDGCIANLCAMCTDDKLKGIAEAKKDYLYDLYSKYPAATAVHHAFPGGLLNHTYQMLHMLEGLYPTMPYQDDIKLEYCILAIMYHDFGKIAEYTVDGECTKEMYLLGHIFMSAQMINDVLKEAGVDKDVTRLIVHCVLSHHGELEYGSPIKPCIPEAQLVNYLDNISAKADIFNTTGNMEKSFALGTHVVK